MRKFYGKLITIALTSAMVLGLAGCAEKEVTTSEPINSETTVASTSETSVSTETSVPSEIPESLPETDTSENDKEEKTEDDDKKFYSGTLTEVDKKLYVIKEVSAKTLPGQTGEVVRTLPVGTEVHVVGKDTDTGWYCLEDGTFISSSSTYLSATKPKEEKQETSTQLGSTGSSTGTQSGNSGSTGGDNNTGTGTSTQTPAPTPTPEPTPAPQPQVCQHTNTEDRVIGNTGRPVGSNGGCGQHGDLYHTFCKDCGADLGNERTVWGAITHSEHSEVIIDDYGECGGSGTSHIHHYCDCGEINYNDAPVTSPNPHSMRAIQYYDADGNLCETNQCAFCGWEDGSDHIVQYASGD